MATYLRSDGWVKTALGQAVAGAHIYVCSQPANIEVPPSPLVQIYADVNGIVPITQPVVTDGFGHYYFYVSSTTYTVVVINGGLVQQVYPDQAPMNVGGGGGGSSITLLTNGVNNLNQTRLNIINGSGISLVADASGNLTIINTAGGGGGGTSVTLQTNSVSNSVQTLLNLKPGTSINVTSDLFGGVTFDLASVVNATTGIQINGAAPSGNVLRGNGTNFVAAQLGYGDLSGVPTLAATIAAASHQWLASYNAATGAFTQTQPVYADISGTPQIAQTKAAIASNFLTSYTASTGVFTSAQPAYSDISGTPQLANTNAGSASHFLSAYSSVTGNFSTAQPTFTDLAAHPTTLAGYGITDGTASPRVASLNFVIDGGGSVPATGAYGQINVPVACTVTGWVLTADAGGAAVVDVLRSTYANFPTTSTIAGTDKPTLTATSQKNENLAEASWGSTALAAGDQIQVNLNSVATCKRLNLTINVTIP